MPCIQILASRSSSRSSLSAHMTLKQGRQTIKLTGEPRLGLERANTLFGLFACRGLQCRKLGEEFRNSDRVLLL